MVPLSTGRGTENLLRFGGIVLDQAECRIESGVVAGKDQGIAGLEPELGTGM